ncbi:hypothetical protein CRG98_012803 [Punica granatum]|uniref:G-patch domain-containing protein n=1 Tax=Punica granatum TaxID=22663 RepID=A0A2I0KE49_PUNGR|nr:hypothetical protein CRG98_012803 [Punica granatum]
MTKMREDHNFQAYATEWRGKAAKYILPITERQQVQLFHSTLRGAYYSHLLVHTSSFSDLIEAGKKLDMGVKLGRIEGPSRKNDGETSKKQIAGTSKKGKDATVGAVNFEHQASQPISVDYTSALQTHPVHYVQPYQVPVLLVTLNIYWRLWDKIQEMINTKQISFNEVKPLNMHANPLPDHGSGSGPSVNMISIVAIRDDDDLQEIPIPFIIDYPPAEVAFTSAPFVIKVPAKEPYQDRRVPWDYGGRFYQGPELANKGKAPAAAFSTIPETPLFPLKKVTKQEAETFMKISFADDELPSEGQGHLRALHIVCKCNNHVVGRVMIDNGFALNVCPVSTLKQMNVDMSRIRASKTTVRAFDGSRREVNGEIDLLINVGPCSFSVTFQILKIPNAFSLLLGRPWIHAASAVPSSLHQKLKFFVEGKLITINDEEDYAVYKETAVPYISIGEDQNLPFHSFDTIFMIRDYEEVGPSQVHLMIGKVLLNNDYVPGTGLGARAQGILRPIEVEEYRNKRGLGFHPSCQEIVQARRGKHLHRLAAHYGKLSKGIPVPSLSHFFPTPPLIMGGTSDSPSTESYDSSSDAIEAFLALPAIYAVTEETSFEVHIRHAREDEELTNWTAVPLYLAMVANVQDSLCI